jgi:serine protease Do
VCLLAAGLGLSGCPGNDERPSGYYERPRLDAGRLAPRGAEGRAGSPAAGPDTRAPGPDGGAEGGDTAGPGATAAPPVDLTRMPLPDFAALYRGVRPSVVSVYTTRRPLPPRLPVGPSRFADAIGSGVVLTPGGEILTNHHVVENATGVWVRLSDGRTFRAQTAGTDPPTDLALLKVDGVGGALQAATLGDSDAVQVGDWVLAVGNPFGLEQSVTRGIVSAKGRREVAPELGGYVDWLQTDAAINPGSSGGPLFDLGGRVVGINAALSAEGQRLSFAIPVNLARDVVQRLRTTGQVTRGWLGVVAAPSEPGGDPGVRVADVVPGSPAARAGLQAGDVVVALDGEPLDAPFDLRWRVAMAGVGARVKLTVRRDGEERLVSVKLATLAPQPPAEPPR